jgi:S1-C subfamily serine protease
MLQQYRLQNGPCMPACCALMHAAHVALHSYIYRALVLLLPRRASMSVAALAALERLHASGALESLLEQHGGDGAPPAKRSRRAADAVGDAVPLASGGPTDSAGRAEAEEEEDGRWSEVVKRCSKAVVVIRCARVRAFDACDARFGVPPPLPPDALAVAPTCISAALKAPSITIGHATGFVVDRRRGLILTNRHVVTDGPVTADAIFLSKEEVALTPFYRDPVHDFAFFRFNPNQVT